jgi:hypothetical protein
VGRSAHGTSASLWDGISWTAQKIPNPPNLSSSFAWLTSVSCTTVNFCEAVGSYTPSGEPEAEHERTLAETWNGTHWTVQFTKNPGLTTWADRLTGVSCTGPNMCEAVGYYTKPLGKVGTFAEGWNGVKWKLQTTIDPTTYTNDLNGVSCTSATDCEAVGNYTTGFRAPNMAVMEMWNGSTWQVQSTSIAGALSSVSCSSSSDCQAVGEIAAGWDGALWTAESFGTPCCNTSYPNLYAVSCPVDGTCEAVGYYYQDVPSAQFALAEVWDGSEWVFQQIPSPSGSTASALSAVSCTAVNFCEAVAPKLAEGWNGTAWTIQT